MTLLKTVSFQFVSASGEAISGTQRYIPEHVLILFRVCGEAIPGLQVGIESVIRGTLRPWLIGEIALRHSQIVRAENALTRTREGLRQDR